MNQRKSIFRPSAPSEQPIRVLIVEDNPGDAELEREQLLDAPTACLEPITARNLTDARMFLNRVPIEATILDLDLPDSTGLDTLRRLRESHPDVPVVVVSGSVDEDLREAALAAGAQEVISKDDIPSRLFALSILYVVERNRAVAHREQLESVIEASPDAMLLVDRAGRVLFLNEAAVSLFGRSREELLDETLSFASTRGQSVEIRIPHGDSERIGELRVVDLDWEEGAVTLATIRDVTAEKHLETQLMLSDRMVSLGTLAAGVAHEVNTPLMSVLLNLEHLDKALDKLGDRVELPQGMEQELDDARESARQVQQIVGDLRVFSRPEEAKFGPVDVHRVIDSALRMAHNQMWHRARIVRDYGHGVPLAQGNESRLGQVLLNLLVNAAHAIEECGGGDHEIRVATRREGYGPVVISVSDTGCGIPEEVRGKLFTPFYTTKPIGKGTGLGLAISQRIMSEMEGKLWYTSEVGKGTTFHLSLPWADPSRGSIRRSREATTTTASMPNVGAIRILLIDDDARMLRALERQLKQHHQVVSTTDAGRALKWLGEGLQVDLVLCDLMMPRITGMEFYDQLEEIAAEHRERIAFMTGGVFTEEAREFLDRVDNPRLDKPVNLEELDKLIGLAIRKAHARGRRLVSAGTSGG